MIFNFILLILIFDKYFIVLLFFFFLAKYLYIVRKMNARKSSRLQL